MRWVGQAAGLAAGRCIGRMRMAKADPDAGGRPWSAGAAWPRIEWMTEAAARSHVRHGTGVVAGRRPDGTAPANPRRAGRRGGAGAGERGRRIWRPQGRGGRGALGGRREMRRYGIATRGPAPQGPEPRMRGHWRSGPRRGLDPRMRSIPFPRAGRPGGAVSSRPRHAPGHRRRARRPTSWQKPPAGLRL